MKPFGYSMVQKVLYYIVFAYHKISILWECSAGLGDVLRAELYWIAGLFRLLDPYKQTFTTTYVENVFGKFFIQPSTNGVYMASPAFERTDVDRLISLMREDCVAGRKVLFLDVGAYYGDYVVRVGNALKEYGRQLTTIAFEPEASNFADNNVELLFKNIKVNNLLNVTVHKQGLGDRNTTKPNSFGVITKRLDTILSPRVASSYDSVYIKIDIEGGETAACMGAEQFMKSCRKLTILVEDFIDPKVITYLEKRFRFLDKLSPQNSFWIKP